MYMTQTGTISIHKALTGLDWHVILIRPYRHISIHKALTGLDPVSWMKNYTLNYFNPQGPHGPRHWDYMKGIVFDPFQSTRPSRASTNPLTAFHLLLTFQSTRPSRASTYLHLYYFQCFRYFNPQGPHGPRRSSGCADTGSVRISIHKALTGLDGIPLPG